VQGAIQLEGQRRSTSFLESIVNCLTGIAVATVGQLLLFPLLGINIPFSTTGAIALIFTGISVVRSYLLRRLFEWLRVSGRLR
jgi:hypothetical protein